MSKVLLDNYVGTNKPFDVSAIPDETAIGAVPPYVAGWHDIDSDLKSIIKKCVDEYMYHAKFMGLHLIGDWDESPSNDDVKYIFYHSIQHFFPYIKVLLTEFVNIDPHFIEERDTTGSARTTGGSEDSPIDALALEPVADDATWNLANPIAKYGNKSESGTHYENSRNDPELELRLLKFSIENLNLQRIVELICNKCIEEYNTIF